MRTQEGGNGAGPLGALLVGRVGLKLCSLLATCRWGPQRFHRALAISETVHQWIAIPPFALICPKSWPEG
jgi:hypothetical protein